MASRSVSSWVRQAYHFIEGLVQHGADLLFRRLFLSEHAEVLVYLRVQVFADELRWVSR